MRCPKCNEEIVSGIGFQLGNICNKRYKIGDELSWEGTDCRPKVRPDETVIKAVGYFNCDNPHCDSWEDCFPDVQMALITVENNYLKSATPYSGEGENDEELGNFPILEPLSLRNC